MDDLNYKTKVVDGTEVFYATEWISELEKEIHFNWYYHQARIVYQNCTRNQRLLEIGLGTGLLSGLLKKRGWSIKTLDIDSGKDPDFAEDAMNFDYVKHQFGVVLAFEIFEHMPFSVFENVVKQFSSSGVRSVYFSIPWNERELINLHLKLPKTRVMKWRVAIPAGKITTHAHFWELATRKKRTGQKQLIPLPEVERVFELNGFRLRRLDKVGYIQFLAAERTD